MNKYQKISPLVNEAFAFVCKESDILVDLTEQYAQLTKECGYYHLGLFYKEAIVRLADEVMRLRESQQSFSLN